MRFEQKDLTPYAEPVSANELKQESVYFFVTFADEALLIPSLEAVVFLGRNLEDGDEGIVYFQDFDSYHQGIRYGSSSGNPDAMVYIGSENEVNHIFEYEHALEELMRCSVRRKARH